MPLSEKSADEATSNVIETGVEPEYFVDDMPQYDLIENTSVRLYCGAKMRKFVHLRYYAVIPRSTLRTFAAMLIAIADLMDRIDKDKAAAMH